MHRFVQPEPRNARLARQTRSGLLPRNRLQGVPSRPLLPPSPVPVRGHDLRRLSIWPAASPARTGGDAPVPIKPLTPEDRLIDLQATRFRDDARLQQAFDNNPPLRAGDTGPAVEKLQQALLDLGFFLPKSTKKTGTPDGIFGQETQTVVKGFQWRQGIVQDGVVGRQTLGELDGLFTGQTATGTGPSGPATPGTALTVTTIDRTPKQFGRCGGFTWGIDWETNARNGYLVQEIIRTTEMTECPGPAPPVEPRLRYWEAWRVQQDGGIHGTSGPDDDWRNQHSSPDPLDGNPGTRGRWRITGTVYFVNQLDPAAGFQVNKVPEAGSLWATQTQPGNLTTPLLVRTEADAWNCCAATPGTAADEPPPTSPAPFEDLALNP